MAVLVVTYDNTTGGFKFQKIGSSQISDGAITSSRIASGIIGTVHLRDGAVTSAKIASGYSPPAGPPADESITSAKLASGAVGGDRIWNLGIISGKIASGAMIAEMVGAVPAGQGGDFAYERYIRSGNYHIPVFMGATTTISIERNKIWAVPYYTGPQKTLKGMAIHVTTAQTSGYFGSGAMGVYFDTGNVYPGNLLLNANQVLLASAALKSITGLNTVLSANTLFWLIVNASTSATVAGYPVGTSPGIMGYDTALNVNPYTFYLISSFYLSGFPASMPAGGLVRNTISPKIGVIVI